MTRDEQLDQALARSLPRPEPPTAFTARWRCAIRDVDSDAAERLRAQLERERRERLAAFREEFLRMRRRTFAACIGVAFVAGAAADAAMPWLLRHYGGLAGLAVPFAIAVGGAGAGIWSALRRSDF
jgi:hypothetical protein